MHFRVMDIYSAFEDNGIPDNIISDRDPRFTSQFWEQH